MSRPPAGRSRHGTRRIPAGAWWCRNSCSCSTSLPPVNPERQGDTMTRAIRYHEYGGPEVLKLEESVLADPAPAEVRIRQAACGLNFLDTYQRSGLYKVPLPSGAGNEGAGVVEAVGSEVTHLKPGDRVAYAG